ncbi:MAG: DUF11 domain-containing protein, partial [Chloroflexi bacterium]|nr:DUF11 domain-containing protein [Chloroflexota bacterium]
MDRVYKVLCVWMVLAITVLGLVPMAAAQEPGGAEGYASEALAGREFVPPMPGLKEFMQEAGWSEDGISLSADMSAEEAQLNYEAYLAKKLDPKATIPGVTRITPKADAEGAGLLAAPANSRVVVGLVRFQDLDPCTGTLCTILPKGPDDNTTYHIDPDPNLHYRRMLFETPENNPWSMRSYFREASYKSFDLKGDVLGWNNVPRLPQAAAYYGTDPVGGGLDQNLAQFVKDSADRILPLLPTSGHSDTDYGTADVYGTVVLDYFFIVHAGRGQETGGGPLGSKALWSTAGTLSPTHVVRTNNAVFAVKNFVVVAENSPVGVFVHEMGHLFGLPDTWNYSLGVKDPFNYGLGIKPGAPNTGEHDDMPWPDQDYGASGGEASPAFYDPMAQGCWLGMPPGTMPASMTAWERIQLGWLRPYEWSICDWPRPVKLEQINDQHDNRAIKIKLDKSKVYVTPYSGSYMRGAPAPADMTSPSILTHTFQITATGSASLKYQQWYDLEPNADKGYVQVRVSPAGAWSAKVNQVTGNSGGWAGAVLNLNAYVGKTIDVRFVLERDSAIEGLGWFLDDFALEQDGKDTWKDDTELSADGPPQGAGNYTWQRLRFPRREEIASEHYYLLEWRNDGGEYHEIGDSGFDRGLQQVFNWVNAATGQAQYYRYNPGLLIWYVNPIYSDNDVLSHPGEGMILLVDSHPDPLYESTKPWRTRVQMQDATFRQNGKFTYVNQLLDTATPPVLKTMGGLAAVDTFWDKPANKYYRSTIPDNSVKTPGTGLKVKVTLEERAQWGAWLQLSTDGTEITGVKLNDPPDIVEPGDTIEYTIVITNTGLRTCNLSVYDPAPQFATYNVGSLVPPPTGTYTETADGRGSWRWVGTIEANETLTFRFSVTLDPVIMTGTLIINTAYVYEGPTPKAELTATNVVHAEPCLAFSTKTVEWAEWHPNQQGVLPGDLLTYTIALRNTGNMTATAWLTDCLPPCTTLVPGSVGFRPTQLVGAWRFDGQCLYWNSEVPVGGMTPTVWFTFTVKIDPASSACCTQYCSQIINTAYLTDPAACDEFELTATAIVGKGPNLRDSLKRVTNVDPGLAVKPGARLDYEIEIFNAGNESATVVVDDPIPANTTYIDDSMAVRKNGVLVCAGNSCPGEPPPKVYWTGTIGMGDKITVTFSVSVANPLANGTIITNTAVITEKYKHWTKVYERTTQTTVRSEPWFGDGSYKTDQYAGAPATAAYGSVLTYTIVLHNTGTEAAATVFVTDKIPVGTVHDPLVHAKSASMPTVSYNPSIGPLGAILWKGGPIAPGGRVTITFEVSITERLSRIIENVAEVDDGWPTHEHLFLREYTRIAALEVVTPTGDIYCGDAFCVP